MCPPLWADDVLRCPDSGDKLKVRDDKLVNCGGSEVARIEQGIIRFPIAVEDDSIVFYRGVGGAHFHERAAVPFAMSSLDTPIYHSRVDEILPANESDFIIDVGGGDGRMATRCLSRGLGRVIVVDAIAEALLRFRERLAKDHPAWLDRLLLIEADFRSLPLRPACAAAIIAIEALCYLNEDYEIGLRQCVRVLAPSGKILISDRDYEGGLVLRLLYNGIAGMLQLAHNRSLLDGNTTALVRSRCFTQSELVDICRKNGLKPLHVSGTSILSLVLGYLNGRSSLDTRDAEQLPDVTKLLSALGADGIMRRCNVIIAEREDR